MKIWIPTVILDQTAILTPTTNTNVNWYYKIKILPMLPNGNTTRLDPQPWFSLFKSCLLYNFYRFNSIPANNKNTTTIPVESKYSNNNARTNFPSLEAKLKLKQPLLPQNWSWPANPTAPFPSISTYVLGFGEFLVSLNKPTKP